MVLNLIYIAFICVTDSWETLLATYYVYFFWPSGQIVDLRSIDFHIFCGTFATLPKVVT